MDENSQELLFEVFLGIVACLSIFVIHLPILSTVKSTEFLLGETSRLGYKMQFIG